MIPRKITIGITLFGNAIYFRYIAYVKYDYQTITFIPIGREITYMINSVAYTTYHSLPIIIYRPEDTLEFIGKEKLENLFKFLEMQMRRDGTKIYKDDGVRIEYIDQESLIGQDGTTVPLVNGQPPQEQQIRVLMDISDQLGKFYPRADVTLSFYLKGGDNFIIQQIDSFMQFKYFEDYTVFSNNNIGRFIYSNMYGTFNFFLTKDFENMLSEKFRLNFPDNKSKVKIALMALEAHINFKSILYKY